MKIQILDSVYCKVNKDDAKILNPCLSYQKTFWRQGRYSKKEQVYRKKLISKGGLFLTGFLPRVKRFCKDNSINLSIEGQIWQRSPGFPNLPGIEFRDDQYELIQLALVDSRGVIKSPTRTGKTIVAFGVISAYPKTKVLILAHTTSIVRQAIIKAREFNLLDRVKVKTIQSFVREDPKDYCDKYDIVIVDECFSKNTRIRTINGNKSIGEIDVGEIVLSYHGLNRVKRVFKNKILLFKIVKLTLSNNKVVFCSEDHLFFSDNWVRAKETLGKYLFTLSDYKENNTCGYSMSDMQKGSKKLWRKVLFKRMLSYFQENQSKDREEMSCMWYRLLSSWLAKILFVDMFCKGKKKERTKVNRQSMSCVQMSLSSRRRFSEEILFKDLYLQRSRAFKKIIRMDDQIKRTSERCCKREDEEQQSYVRPFGNRKNVKYKKNKWNFAYLAGKTWRKWEFYFTTKITCFCVELANGGSYSTCSSSSMWTKASTSIRSRLSNELQSRYRERAIENRNRSRWKLAQKQKREIKRQKEGRQTKRVRVESVEIYQRGYNDKSFSSIISDKEQNQGFVEFYDLEVENSHTYFAEDVLVHNCHHISSFEGMYAKILSQMLTSIRFGLTATMPVREETKMALEGHIGPVIGELTMQEAAELEILAKPRVTIRKVLFNQSVKKLRKYPDVYEQGVVQNRSLNRLVVKEAKEILDSGGTVLILVVKIAHGENIVDMAKKLYGLDLVFVQGSTNGDVREEIRQTMISKKVKGVIATAVFREGIDIPSLDAVVNACGGKSEIMSLQAVGRGLTKVEGKIHTTIVDFFNPSHHYLISHFGERISLYCEQEWL